MQSETLRPSGDRLPGHAGVGGQGLVKASLETASSGLGSGLSEEEGLDVGGRAGSLCHRHKALAIRTSAQRGSVSARSLE